MVFTIGSVCSEIKFSNNRKKTSQLSFFKFPKDPERSRKWLVNSRQEDLMKKDPVYLCDNIRFCSLHFEQNQFMNADNNKFVWNAVPALFDIPNKPSQLTMKRKLSQRFDSFYCHFKSYEDKFGSLVICSENVCLFLRDCENQMASVFDEHFTRKTVVNYM
ncbi:52 kDa repressor of the inhibitor of the protein kinase-like [Schistocerca cancellata]|uniref:52 kDa repressor of the inhibitor of the protein kinase-like n=1 Tax=Schistocerca cancellata TaxID=274614 RepID=UPI00211749DB|nr:52 kDa repressor of the inhibitor of the protein kinase-like [Schistocerca cancellata]